jgi:hypothetical protein
MCPALRFGAEHDCKFKQISVSSDDKDVTDTYAVNVPLNDDRSSCIIMFHLNPLVGSFFVVFPSGSLQASYYRAKGVDYTELSKDDAHVAFEATMSFFRSNLARIHDLVSTGSPMRR